MSSNINHLWNDGRHTQSNFTFNVLEPKHLFFVKKQVTDWGVPPLSQSIFWQKGVTIFGTPPQPFQIKYYHTLQLSWNIITYKVGQGVPWSVCEPPPQVEWQSRLGRHGLFFLRFLNLYLNSFLFLSLFRFLELTCWVTNNLGDMATWHVFPDISKSFI